MATELWTPVPRHAVRHIQQMILDGSLRPGSRLPSQRQLAETLKLSRASLREALSALETLGLIRIEPGRGAFVNDPSEARTNDVGPWRFADRFPLHEVYQLRYALEGFIAGQAAKVISKEQLTELEAAWIGMRDAIGSGDLAAAADCDFRFHQILIEAGGNSMVSETWNGVRNVLFASQSLPFAHRRKSNEPVAEHGKILDAVGRHDSRSARLAMEDHIRGAATRVGIAW